MRQDSSPFLHLISLAIFPLSSVRTVVVPSHRGRCQRQNDPKDGSFPLGADGADLAAVNLDDAVRDGEPQAAAVLFGGRNKGTGTNYSFLFRPFCHPLRLNVDSSPILTQISSLQLSYPKGACRLTLFLIFSISASVSGVSTKVDQSSGKGTGNRSGRDTSKPALRAWCDDHGHCAAVGDNIALTGFPSMYRTTVNRCSLS